MLNNIYKHLDKPGNTVRIMFYDFSSAFNTIQPHLLVQKMKLMNIPQCFIKWIFSYITNRPQFVRLSVSKGVMSNFKKSITNNFVNSMYSRPTLEHLKAQFFPLFCLRSILQTDEYHIVLL